MSAVRIFVTPSCAHSRAAREHLTSKGIEHTVHDVTSDRAALNKMLRLTDGVRRVPVISVGEETLIGYERDILEDALNRLLK